MWIGRGILPIVPQVRQVRVDVLHSAAAPSARDSLLTLPS
jgi:hypothetical protein